MKNLNELPQISQTNGDTSDVWMDVLGYEGIYKISRFGDVKTIERKQPNGTSFYRARIRKITVTPKGYHRINLCKLSKQKAFFIHRLVAIAYLSNPNNYSQINHIDGDKSNNHVSNLEWCSDLQNKEHAKYVLGVRPSNLGVLGSTKKKSVFKIDINTGSIICKYDSLSEAKRGTPEATNVAGIGNAANGIQKSAFGFIWKFNN